MKSDRLTKTVWAAVSVLVIMGCATALAQPLPIQWTRIADLPGDQHAACAAVIDGLVYLVGGINPSGPVYNKMRIYDPTTDSWSDSLAMPTPRLCPGSGVIQTPNSPELYVVGGYSGSAGLSTVERYIPPLGTWETAASVTNSRGNAIMTAVVNNNLYAMGGHYNGDQRYATNEIYDRPNDVWIAKAPIEKDGQPFPLAGGMPAVWSNKIFIFGGYPGYGPITTTLIYDTLTDTWSEGAEMPRGRSSGRAVTFGDYIYLIAGAEAADPTIDVYQPATDSWFSTTDYPGDNSWYPVIAQSDNLVYVLGDTYDNPPGQLECWVGELQVSEPTCYYYVDGKNGNDGNDGLTLETAFATIQKGISEANDGCTVLVYPDVYEEPINFDGKAITVQGVAAANGVPLIQTPGNYAVSFYNDEEPNSVLKNFVIRNSFVGIFVADAFPTLHNLTIVDNDSGVAAYAGAAPDISNCIFYNNADDLFDCEARYSWLGQDANYPNDPNGPNTPMFVDADANIPDHHLKSERGRYWPEHNVWVLDQVTSPCIDGGDPNCNPGDEPMPNGGRINMGAYGGTAHASMSEWPVPGDINRDGVVNFFDVAIVAQSWLEKLAWVE